MAITASILGAQAIGAGRSERLGAITATAIRMNLVLGAALALIDPLREWQLVADDVRGRPLACGHYIAEEAPDALLDAALPFLLQAG